MTILKFIFNFLENYNRLSTAVYLARCGDHKGSLQIMMENFGVRPKVG
jgi:hypothetical protein